jgi:hypothetical protein
MMVGESIDTERLAHAIGGITQSEARPSPPPEVSLRCCMRNGQGSTQTCHNLFSCSFGWKTNNLDCGGSLSRKVIPCQVAWRRKATSSIVLQSIAIYKCCRLDVGSAERLDAADGKPREMCKRTAWVG